MTQYKLTPQDLENQIAKTEYQRFGETGMLAVITLQNGYTVTGESGCIDPAIFNEEIGQKVAYENAFNKLWQILGYGVKQKWYEETQLTWLERVRIELAELYEKRSKLKAMLQKDKPEFVLQIQWDLMHKQYEAMSKYILILAERMKTA
ncbi:Gp49 family protein [Mannheimia haemolytica]|uniref:Gp49 family protein n=1 Tax=Mannheimia haemolytica TaxID=75985 RepID=UPI002ECC4B5E|nr:Gp49 family protein [Mannheimia haemolytica]